MNAIISSCNQSKRKHVTLTLHLLLLCQSSGNFAPDRKCVRAADCRLGEKLPDDLHFDSQCVLHTKLKCFTITACIFNGQRQSETVNLYCNCRCRDDCWPKKIITAMARRCALIVHREFEMILLSTYLSNATHRNVVCNKYP